MIHHSSTITSAVPRQPNRSHHGLPAESSETIPPPCLHKQVKHRLEHRLKKLCCQYEGCTTTDLWLAWAVEHPPPALTNALCTEDPHPPCPGLCPTNLQGGGAWPLREMVILMVSATSKSKRVSSKWMGRQTIPVGIPRGSPTMQIRTPSTTTTAAADPSPTN